MTFAPEDYFSSFEVTVHNLDELAERNTQVEALSARRSIEYMWRGQANAAWGMHSSLHRGIASSLDIPISKVTDHVLEKVESLLLREARPWVRPSVGAHLPSVDLIARMQHHGIPTRLIDFSRNPFVAAFFACVDQPEKDGRILVAAGYPIQGVEFHRSFQVPWSRSADSRPAGWGKRPYVLDDQQDFVRIRAQNGVFLVGATPSTTPLRRVKHTGYALKADQVRACLSLPLALHSFSQAEAAVSGKTLRGRKPTQSSAMTIRIPAIEKSRILGDLETMGYSMASLFPDLQGLSDYGDIVGTVVGR